MFYLNFIWSFFLLRFSFELLDSVSDYYQGCKINRKRHARANRHSIGRVKFHK